MCSLALATPVRPNKPYVCAAGSVSVYFGEGMTRSIQRHVDTHQPSLNDLAVLIVGILQACWLVHLPSSLSTSLCNLNYSSSYSSPKASLFKIPQHTRTDTHTISLHPIPLLTPPLSPSQTNRSECSTSQIPYTFTFG